MEVGQKVFQISLLEELGRINVDLSHSFDSRGLHMDSTIYNETYCYITVFKFFFFNYYW